MLVAVVHSSESQKESYQSWLKMRGLKPYRRQNTSPEVYVEGPSIYFLGVLPEDQTKLQLLLQDKGLHGEILDQLPMTGRVVLCCHERVFCEKWIKVDRELFVFPLGTENLWQKLAAFVSALDR